MPENAPRFIHLRTHSEHSLLEGAVPVKKLAELAAQNAMPAVALTDSNALFAALEFSVKAQDAGVQPIMAARSRWRPRRRGRWCCWRRTRRAG